MSSTPTFIREKTEREGWRGKVEEEMTWAEIRGKGWRGREDTVELCATDGKKDGGTIK